MVKTRLTSYLHREADIAPLAVFRVLFGAVTLYSTVRFAALGWIEAQYITPRFHFTYYGFSWVQPLDAAGMYGVFLLMGIGSLGVMLGLFYRVSILLFFLTFTYVELLDKTYYLNHYYFVSVVGFLLALAPANRAFSIDALRKPEWEVSRVNCWAIDMFKLQIGIVYFYAGVVKINGDWLFNALPLRIWLPAHDTLPLIGWAFRYSATAVAFSWAGMLFDTTVPFFLLWRRSRPLAYLAVVLFHTVTGLLFQIGVFPLVMIALTPIFFSEAFHRRLIDTASVFLFKACIRLGFNRTLHRNLSLVNPRIASSRVNTIPGVNRVIPAILVFYFTAQLLLPWRFLLYPDNVYWTEEGYRFAWRVMLMEKAGTATFYVKDSETGREGEVVNSEFLNAHQEKQMSMQPDMILQFAHFLRRHYEARGIKNPEVRAEVYVTLNARPSKLLVNPHTNLAAEPDGFSHYTWLLPFND